MFKKVIVPDFSSRGEAVAPPNLYGRSLPPVTESAPPILVDYNESTPLPPYMPVLESNLPQMQNLSIPTITTVNSFVPVVSQLLPEGTYSGINNPKFLINPTGNPNAGAAPGPTGPTGPAGPGGAGGVTSLNFLTGPVTITQGQGISLFQIGQNISIANTAPPTSNWASFRARNNVDISGFDLNNVSTIQGSNLTVKGANSLSLEALQNLRIASQGSFGTAGQVLTSNGTNTIWQTPPVYQATYYKSVQQNLVNANTDITFNQLGPWSNVGGYITHVSGTADFTVVIAGLYQLEFNVSINANGATWNNSVNKSVSIDITRIGVPEQAVIINTGMKQTGLSYQQQVSSSYYLEVGDIINCRTVLAYASAIPFAVGLLNTFDLNTFFTWRYITA